jgi:hypothetical protein
MAVTLNGSGQVIVQIVQAVKTNTQTTSSQSFVDITDLSVSITPTNSNNKILVIASVNWCANGYSDIRIVRNSTPIAVGDAASTRIQSTFHTATISTYIINSANMMWLDAPATTSATTYKLQFANPYNAGATTFVNRTTDDSDSNVNARTASTITVMEVSGT